MVKEYRLCAEGCMATPDPMRSRYQCDQRFQGWTTMASLPGPTPIHSILTPINSWMRAMYFFAFSGRSSHLRACTQEL